MCFVRSTYTLSFICVRVCCVILLAVREVVVRGEEYIGGDNGSPCVGVVMQQVRARKQAHRSRY